MFKQRNPAILCPVLTSVRHTSALALAARRHAMRGMGFSRGLCLPALLSPRIMEGEVENPNGRVRASEPWIEKYRPARLDDIIAHKEIVGTIQRLIDSNQMPHLLLYGPPGTGKTSTILAIAKKLFGSSYRRAAPPHLVLSSPTRLTYSADSKFSNSMPVTTANSTWFESKSKISHPPEPFFQVNSNSSFWTRQTP